MKRVLAVAVAFLVALGVVGTPATAATVTPSVTSSIDWMGGDVYNVQFGADGRLWAWNWGYSPELGFGPQLNVFDKNDLGDWEHSYRLTRRNFDPTTVRFDDSNRMYVTNTHYGTSELLIVSFKIDGTVKKVSKLKFKKNDRPLDAYPTGAGRIFLQFDNRIAEYKLPLTRKSKPVRTIVTPIESWSRMIAGDDRTVYVTQGSTAGGGVDVFTPLQSGTVTPARSFTISSEYSTGYPTDISFTADGKLAVCAEYQGVGIFPLDESGDNQAPATWYPSSSIATNHLMGFDFDDSGVLVVADMGAARSIKWYLE